MSSILTLNQRHSFGLKVDRATFKMNAAQFRHWILEHHRALVHGLAEHGIDYQQLGPALVPSTKREEMALLFNVDAIGDWWYSAYDFHHFDTAHQCISAYCDTAYDCDVTIESLALHNFEDRAAKAILRRKLQINARDLVALLADLVDTSAPTTQPDHDFLTTYAGLTDAELEHESVSGIDANISANRARASIDVQGVSLTTQEVARMLNMDPANVRRAVLDGTLYSVKPTPGSHHRFPKWQFVDGRPLPGLRDVIGALPDDYHPLEVAQFIAEPVDTLRNMSPSQWLAGGGSISDVVALADGRSWE